MRKFIVTGITFLLGLHTATAGLREDENRIALLFETLYQATSDSARTVANQAIREQISVTLRHDSLLLQTYLEISLQ